jgi:hypothetical protein
MSAEHRRRDGDTGPWLRFPVAYYAGSLMFAAQSRSWEPAPRELRRSPAQFGASAEGMRFGGSGEGLRAGAAIQSPRLSSRRDRNGTPCTKHPAALPAYHRPDCRDRSYFMRRRKSSEGGRGAAS